MARLGRWIGMGLVTAGVATWLGLPWLTVAVASRACPLPLPPPGGTVTGVGWQSPDHSGLVVEVTPDLAWTIATVTSGRWLPHRCLRSGQTAWGQGPGHLPMNLLLTDEATPARVSGHLSPSQAAAVIAALRPPGASWDAGLTTLSVTSRPPEGDLARIAVSGRGHLDVAGFQLDIEQLEAEVAIHAVPGSPQAEVKITTLRLVGGQGEALRDLLGTTASSALTRALRQAPAWTPWATAIDVQVRGPTVEL